MERAGGLLHRRGTEWSIVGWYCNERIDRGQRGRDTDQQT